MNCKRQRDSENAEKGKKRNKREERAELSALLEDEDVKRGVKESWSQRAQYSHGQLLASYLSYMCLHRAHALASLVT